MQTGKAVLVAAVAAIYLLVNLPLLYLLAFHKPAAILPIMGHAPNQFLFLSLFFPFVLWALYQLAQITLEILRSEPVVAQSGFAKWLLRRGGVLVTSLLIGGVIAITETRETLPDFYHHEPEVAAEAAALNKEIVVALSELDSLGDPRDAMRQLGLEAEAERLRAIYADGDTLDHVMILFEAIELGAVGFVIAVLIWFVYLYVRMQGLISTLAGEPARKRLRDQLVQAIPFGALALLAVLFWPPFRLYNIYEITLFVERYETVQPVLIYGFAFVVAVALMWLYYSRLRPALITNVIAAASFLVSGALMGWAQITPESMVGYVGSGMGLGNLLMLLLLMFVVFLFGEAIIRQLKRNWPEAD